MSRLAGFVLPILTVTCLAPAAHAAPPPGLRIGIRLVERDGAATKTLAATDIHGPDETDFDIRFTTGVYRLQAQFLTAGAPGGALDVGILMRSERQVGRSERNLPLAEIDEQRKRFHVESDEALVLYPFGKTASGPLLQIQVLLERDPDWHGGPPMIEIRTPAPASVLDVKAYKRPHRFAVLATLDGNAPSSPVECRLDEECTLALQDAAHERRDLRLTVQPDGQCVTTFAFRLKSSMGQSSGAGTVGVPTPLVYSISDPDGRRHELTLAIEPRP